MRNICDMMVQYCNDNMTRDIQILSVHIRSFLVHQISRIDKPNGVNA